MLDIQKFFYDGGSIKELEDRFAIKAKRHNTHNNLVLFKYSQIESDFSKRIVCESRGLILDESDEWKVISRSYNKFFNYGEGNAAEIDWNNCVIQEKVDGSLMTIYWYSDRWWVQSTGMPDASGDLHMTGKSFSDFFWEVEEQYRIHCNKLDKEYSYFFELTSPMNRVVVIHREASLTVLGARHLPSGREVIARDAAAMITSDEPIPYAKGFNLNGIEGIIKSFDLIDPLSQEGYVAVSPHVPYDGTFNRVKIKHPGYVALHHAKDGLSIKAFVEIARKGEVSEVLVAFPEFTEMLTTAKERLEKVISAINEEYIKLHRIVGQKEFALEAVKTKYSSALFKIRAGKASSARQYLAEIHIKSAMNMLGYNDKEIELETLVKDE